MQKGYFRRISLFRKLSVFTLLVLVSDKKHVTMKIHKKKKLYNYPINAEVIRPGHNQRYSLANIHSNLFLIQWLWNLIILSMTNIFHFSTSCFCFFLVLDLYYLFIFLHCSYFIFLFLLKVPLTHDLISFMTICFT